MKSIECMVSIAYYLFKFCTFKYSIFKFRVFPYMCKYKFVNTPISDPSSILF